MGSKDGLSAFCHKTTERKGREESNSSSSNMARLVTATLVVEVCLALLATALFGFAYPNRFRTRLWFNGGVEGWNSNPKSRIYYYANHREPPAIPLIWTQRQVHSRPSLGPLGVGAKAVLTFAQRLTNSNLAIAIFTLTVAVSRGLLFRLGYIYQFVSIGYDSLLCALWAYSVASQASADFSDPEHPSPHPWYLTRGCGAGWSTNLGVCRTAQASFVVSMAAAALYGGRFVFGIIETVLSCLCRRQEGGGWQPIGVDATELTEDEASCELEQRRNRRIADKGTGCPGWGDWEPSLPTDMQ